jgi:YHS domain-containing protein
MGGILWLLMIAALFYLMMRFGCGAHMVHGGHGGHGAGSGGGMDHRGHGESVAETSKDVIRKDPVCGMQFPASTGHSRMYQGQEYRFCSQKCLDQFDAEPARYVTQTGVEK